RDYKTCLGLIRSSATEAVLAEAGQMYLQEEAKMRLKQHLMGLMMKHEQHGLISKIGQRKNSEAYQCLQELQTYKPESPSNIFAPEVPRWQLGDLQIVTTLPGLKGKKSN